MPLLLCPVGLGEAVIFLCSNFFNASMSLLFVWFVVVCFLLGLGFSRPWFWDVVVLKFFCGEFDHGSGRTLAACLTHASRTERLQLAGVLEWRTGE